MMLQAATGRKLFETIYNILKKIYKQLLQYKVLQLATIFIRINFTLGLKYN